MLRKALRSTTTVAANQMQRGSAVQQARRRWLSTVAEQKKPKIFLIYYSMYGHIHKLAQQVQAGVKKVDGVDIEMYQVAETLSPEILQMAHAAPKAADVPVIKPQQLVDADAFLFGIPTRYGTMPSQMKALFDATGGLWAKGALMGKPAGIFFSTGTQAGGQETTALTTLPVLAHHGMIFVPTGYASPHMVNMNEIRGGSAWGAGTLAGGDGSRQPSQIENEIAQSQGENFAKVVRDLYRGRALTQQEQQR